MRTQALADTFLASGAPPMHQYTVEQVRAQSASIQQVLGPGPAVWSVREIVVAADGRDIATRLYEPAEAPGATVVYLHGCEWVVGSLDTHDAMARMLTRESGCRTVSVDYRLAPGAPFLAAVDDAFAALEWAAGTFTQDGAVRDAAAAIRRCLKKEGSLA
jgi:acetyl esterase